MERGNKNPKLDELTVRITRCKARTVMDSSVTETLNARTHIRKLALTMKRCGGDAIGQDMCIRKLFFDTYPYSIPAIV